MREAVKGLKDPQMILLMSNAEQFETHVRKLEELFPGVPSIGCIGMSYDTRVVEKGVGLVAFYGGISAAADVLEEVSVMPVKYIDRLQRMWRKWTPQKATPSVWIFVPGTMPAR